MAEIIQEEKSQKGGRRRPKKHSTHIDMTPMVDLMCLLITFFMLTTAFSKPKTMEIVLPEKQKDKSKPEDQTKIEKSRALTIILSENSSIYYFLGMADPKEPPQIYQTNFSKDGIRKVLLDRNKELFKRIQGIKDEAKKGKLEIPKDWIQSEIKDLTKKIEFIKTDTAYIDSAKIKEFTKKIENLKKGDMDKKDYLEYQIKKFKSEDEVGPIVLIKCYKNVTYKNFVDIIDEMAITNVRTYAVIDLLPIEQQLLDEFIIANN